MSCNSCGLTPGTPLRCGQCKISIYCCAECQRSDWPFHQRLCKKPSPIPTTTTTTTPSSIPAASTPVKETTKEEEEKLEWYRHREWRPEAKQEFKPTKVDEPIVLEDKTTSKSAWNAADTWEEKDMTAWAKQWLQNNLQDEELRVEKISGDASACFVRGKIRYLFDLEIAVKIGNQEVNITDFCDHEENPEVKTPWDFAVDKKQTIKDWIKSKRLLFVNAYQQTVI